MNKKTWISLLASALILCGGAIAFAAVGTQVPKQLENSPLLAASVDRVKTLKEVIFDTQKLVVMIETEDGTQGSGFMYNEQGDFITNAHVVAGFKQVTIKMSDARELQGEVIGISQDIDIAVVRVAELKGMEPLQMARGKQAEIGDEVLAIGSPLGFQNTVTTGIISGLGRSFDIEPYRYKDLYQISASIAKGNSGGPLVVKATGEVIGINSAGIQEGAIGFSIPIINVLALAESWSNDPMTELPELNYIDDSSNMQVEASIDEFGEYLVRHFYDSLNHADYVYAYSLLGGNWKEGTTYEKFREGYLPTRNVVIDELHTRDKGDDTAVVTAIISVDERFEGEYVLSKYQVTYEVGYENDQPKLLMGRGKKIE